MLIKKKLFVFILCTSTALLGNGQIAQWLIPPSYEKIDFAQGDDSKNIIITTDADNYQILWDINGSRLLKNDSTRDVIHPYHNGYAVTSQPHENWITGFFDNKGKFIRLNNESFHYAFSPVFENGYLLVINNDNLFQFIDCNQGAPQGFYVEAYPFNNGYAACKKYAQKEKDRYNLLLDSETMEEVIFVDEKGQFKPDEIDFISSLNDEGKGVIIYKDNVYLYSANNPGRPIPVYLNSKGKQEKEKQVKIEDPQYSFVYDSSGNMVIRAKAKSSKTKKDSYITMTFDSMKAPKSIQYEDTTIYFQPKQTKSIETQTKLEMSEAFDDHGYKCYGLNYDGIEVLPPQLQQVDYMFDDKAIVRLNRKWGMLKVYPDKKFEIQFPDDDKIGFSHKTYRTTIRLLTPTGVGIAPQENDYDPKLIMVNSTENVCTILNDGYRKGRARGDGNTMRGLIDYECELRFPAGGFNERYDEGEDIGRSTVTDTLHYKGQVEYHMLKSPIIDFETEAFHQGYINLDVEDTYIENGAYHFTLVLSTQNNKDLPTLRINVEVTDEYYQTRQLTRDNINTQSNKSYITIDDIQEGKNIISINIVEDDTPGLEYNYVFDYQYTKPQPNKIREKQVISTKVRPKRVGRKRSTAPVTPTPPSTPDQIGDGHLGL